MVYTIDRGLVKEKMSRTALFLLATAFAVTASMAIFAPAQAAGTVTVTGDTAAGENEPGWLFNRDPGNTTPYEFNNDEASIGDGSLYVLPIGANAPDKFIAENFINTPVADVNSISYDFQIGSGGNASDANEFYMNVYANFGQSDDLKFYDCRYEVVPIIGTTAGFTTVTFDPTQSYPVATRSGASASPFACPTVPAAMDGLSAGSNIRMFSLNVGDTSANDTGLDGYLDNVVVSTAGDTTTYDFEVLAGEIVSPTPGETVIGTLNLEATYNGDPEDIVQWAVRKDSCAPIPSNNVFGNVGGLDDDYTWENGVFTASFDVSTLDSGEYCFIFNPGGNQNDVRETVLFNILGGPSVKDECKKGGWEAFGFRNQGLCIQFVNTGRDSR